MLIAYRDYVAWRWANKPKNLTQFNLNVPFKYAFYVIAVLDQLVRAMKGSIMSFRADAVVTCK